MTSALLLLLTMESMPGAIQAILYEAYINEAIAKKSQNFPR